MDGNNDIIYVILFRLGKKGCGAFLPFFYLFFYILLMGSAAMGMKHASVCQREGSEALLICVIRCTDRLV